MDKELLNIEIGVSCIIYQVVNIKSYFNLKCNRWIDILKINNNYEC